MPMSDSAQVVPAMRTRAHIGTGRIGLESAPFHGGRGNTTATSQSQAKHIMKKLVITCLLLSAACAFGQLNSATGGRLADYQNWFGAFNVASDATYPGDPSPPNGLPAANLPMWSGWFENWGASGLSAGGPIIGTDTDPRLRLEFVFLGETAGWKNNWGYRLNGTDTLVSSGIQAAGSTPNIKFGDYGSILLAPGDTVDFFLEGTGVTGGKYYVFDPTLNVPASATMQSYFGNLLPGEGNTVRDPLKSLPEFSYTIVGFEDIRIGASGGDADYNDFIFAFRAAVDTGQGPVPEPSTYGLLAAMALIFLAEYRRRKA